MLKILAISIVVILIIWVGLRILISKTSAPPAHVAQGTQAVTECPVAENCFSSVGTNQPVPAIDSSDPNTDFARLLNHVRADKRAKVITATDTYVHAEYRTPLMGYIDDLELEVTNGRIEIRSASRVGIKDLGVNLARIDQIRNVLKP
jgi:uncharacterized protein (DUF1499 family)